MTKLNELTEKIEQLAASVFSLSETVQDEKSQVQEIIDKLKEGEVLNQVEIDKLSQALDAPLSALNELQDAVSNIVIPETSETPEPTIPPVQF